MKKFIPVLMAVIPLALSNVAHADGRYHHDEGREVAAVVGGVILGSIIAGGRYESRPVYPNEGYTGGLRMKPITHCYIETAYTSYGEPIDIQRCYTTIEPGY